tara:strand:+ start:93 stop:341 length:249 start_codon:yes stop_codon:yes gene_type:complete
MKKVRKLTPATLKRIIAEEKFKLLKEGKIKKAPRKKSNIDAKLLREIKKLILLKKQQAKKIREFKKLHETRKNIKKMLIERL